MKKILSFIFLILLCIPISGFSQDNQPLKKPASGKSMVYFIRSSAEGFAIKLPVFDSLKYVTSVGTGKYVVYECKPGKHLFWAASENRDYVEAELEADKIYVIDVKAQMGILFAQVKMTPFNPKDLKHKKLLHKIVKKLKMTTPNSDTEKAKLKESISVEDGLRKYDELKKSGSSKIEILSKDMYFENANKPSKN